MLNVTIGRKGFGVVLAAGALLSLCGTANAQNAVKADTGKFILTIQENEVGSDTFTIHPDGGSEADATVALGSTKISEHVAVKAGHGGPVEIATAAKPGGNLDLTIHGNKGTLKLQAGKIVTTKEVKISPHPVLFGNFMPHLLNGILAAYDLSKGGPQKFNGIAVDNGTLFTLTLTSTGAKPVQINGKTVAVTDYVLSVPGPIGNIDIDLKADPDHKLLMWNVPSQKYMAVREGYQELTRAEGPVDPTLSKPTFEVKKEFGVKIPMRDGVKLAADIYRPDAPGTFPVILQRTPYGRDKALEATFYARRGYVFVAQDVRGKFGSEGEWHPFVNEARDGHDSVEWCAAQPWSNGSVGMIGASYLGFVQWAAAQEGVGHLKCLIPIVSPPDPFFNVPYAFGSLFLWPDIWWTIIAEGKGMNAIPKLTNLKPFYTLPLSGVDKAVIGHHVPFFQEWLKHPSDDAYWQQVDFNAKMRTLGPLPALNVSGWFDGDGIGTKLNYAAMVDSGHQNQKLIYGPWSHAVNTTTKLGPLDFGPQSLRDLDTLYLRWFDHWLKGVDNGVDREPPVDAFLMGINQWRTFSAWPPKEAQLVKWYFHSAGHANADKSNGTLSTQMPSTNEQADHYAYNPAKPFIPAGLEKAIKVNSDDGGQLTEEVSRDPQLLTYTSAVLTQDVTVAGPISIHLVAASSARDTDWFAVLSDVGADGKPLGLCMGIIRARFRDSFQHPHWLTSDRPEQYNIDLWALGNVFKKGHRIRVALTSSCFPLYARNLNTGADDATSTRMVTAQQTVLHDRYHLSYITLPTLSAQ